MLKGQTTIGRLAARCPAGTEPIVARVRLARLFGGAELAPPGFPPRAVLVIRRVRAAGGVALGGPLLLRPEAERVMREQVAALWRRASRPARGRVPPGAEAVLFEDEGEWLAALGLAVACGEAERHWCWSASRGAGAGASPGRSLARAWGESPRFVPAAVARLAGWGEAARVLGALGPAEAGALYSALASEFELPRAGSVGASSARRARPADDAPDDAARKGAAPRQSNDEGARDARPGGAGVDARGAAPRGEGGAGARDVAEPARPPWGRWLPSLGAECERLPPPTQRLLAYAAALFHAPAHARRSDFAEEVRAFSERVAAPRRPVPPAASAEPRRPFVRHAREDERRDDARARDASSDATPPARPARPAGGATRDGAPPPARAPRVEGDAETEATEARRAPRVDSDAPRLKRGGASVHDPDDEPAAYEPERPWANLDGCETRLGGALFLLNLFNGLRLPECFDEDYGLSEHVTGWGLCELLARSLLGDACAEFERDPLWGALAQLDGRAEGEPPAVSLVVGRDYRAPARWLRLFAPHEGEEAWLYAEDGDRLNVFHPAGFAVAALPLGGLAAAELAARVAEEHRAQGVSVARVVRAEEAQAGPPTPRWPGRFPSFESLRAHGGARLPGGLRRWMGWTFPFLDYALGRLLAESGEPPEGEPARELLVRRGRLYCTATHVDLVFEAAAVSFAARRSGLDASPGWVRDLMRVVAFHFE
ncbi:MAG TPA: hypothetical protein VF668_01975 [Pyrinomonadaceae bacterium]|jgi:hypothetical protein